MTLDRWVGTCVETSEAFISLVSDAALTEMGGNSDNWKQRRDGCRRADDEDEEKLRKRIKSEVHDARVDASSASIKDEPMDY